MCHFYTPWKRQKWNIELKWVNNKRKICSDQVMTDEVKVFEKRQQKNKKLCERCFYIFWVMILAVTQNFFFFFFKSSEFSYSLKTKRKVYFYVNLAMFFLVQSTLDIFEDKIYIFLTKLINTTETARQFESLFYKTDTCLQKTSICIGLQAEQIFFVYFSILGVALRFFFYVISRSSSFLWQKKIEIIFAALYWYLYELSKCV